MRFPPASHTWDVTPAAAIGVQKELRSKIQTDIPITLESVRLVAGVDVSSTRFDTTLTAGVIIWDRISGQIVDSASVQVAGTFPYIPGLLSFREIPVLLRVIQQLKTEPDVWMVDGQGIAHPRRMGIATHLGLVLDRPTIGVGKSKLTGTYDKSAKGDTPLMDKDERIGTVMHTKARSNPLFISPGHKIDQASADALVHACLRGYRLPEPTRLAHLFVNHVRKEMLNGTQQSFVISERLPTNDE